VESREVHADREGLDARAGGEPPEGLGLRVLDRERERGRAAESRLRAAKPLDLETRVESREADAARRRVAPHEDVLDIVLAEDERDLGNRFRVGRHVEVIREHERGPERGRALANRGAERGVLVARERVRPPSPETLDRGHGPCGRTERDARHRHAEIAERARHRRALGSGGHEREERHIVLSRRRPHRLPGRDPSSVVERPREPRRQDDRGSPCHVRGHALAANAMPTSVKRRSISSSSPKFHSKKPATKNPVSAASA
jgi:hypothetical protein